jgi:hypothetical protein
MRLMRLIRLMRLMNVNALNIIEKKKQRRRCSMNAEQREKLMFEIRNRVADLEMIIYEIMRALVVIEEHFVKLVEEKDVYDKVLDLLEKFEVDEFENEVKKEVRACKS